jgi:hypothetical protein
VDEDPVMLDDLRYRELLALTALGRQTLAEFARHADPTKYLPHTPDRGRYKNQTIYRNPITRAWMEKLPEGYEEQEGKVVKSVEGSKKSVAGKKDVTAAVDRAYAHYQAIKADLPNITVDEMRSRASQLDGLPKNVLSGVLGRLGYPTNGTKEEIKSQLLDNLTSLKISYEQGKQIGMPAPAPRPFKTTNDQEYGPLPEHLKNIKLTPLQQDMADVTDDWLRKNRTDIPFDELYKTLQTRHQDLTPEQFKAALRFLHDQDRLRMGGWAFGPHLLPRPELGVRVGSSDREHENKLMWYLHGGSGVSDAGYYTKQPASVQPPGLSHEEVVDRIRFLGPGEMTHIAGTNVRKEDSNHYIVQGGGEMTHHTSADQAAIRARQLVQDLAQRPVTEALTHERTMNAYLAKARDAHDDSKFAEDEARVSEQNANVHRRRGNTAMEKKSWQEAHEHQEQARAHRNLRDRYIQDAKKHAVLSGNQHMIPWISVQ